MDGNAASKPAEGDIVLLSKGTDDEGHLIAIVPGPPKLRFHTYERALSVAQTLAFERGAAIWRTPDGETFKAVDTPRQQGRSPTADLST